MSHQLDTQNFFDAAANKSSLEANPLIANLTKGFWTKYAHNVVSASFDPKVISYRFHADFDMNLLPNGYKELEMSEGFSRHFYNPTTMVMLQPFNNYMGVKGNTIAVDIYLDHDYFQMQIDGINRYQQSEIKKQNKRK